MDEKELKEEFYKYFKENTTPEDVYFMITLYNKLCNLQNTFVETVIRKDDEVGKV